MKRDQTDQALHAFIERQPAAAAADFSPEPRERDDPLIHQLVVSCLAWNAPRAGVAGAVERIRETLVDYNEFRIMIPADAGELLGPKYPLAEERCARLRAALTEVFHRENGLVLTHLREASKRDARSYLESLPGLPAYAVSRVALVGCGVHTFPVDSVLLNLFASAGIVEEGFAVENLAARLERAIRAGDAEERFWAFEAATTRPVKQAAKKTAKKPAAKKTAAKKTAKKTTKKPASTAKKTTKKRSKKPA